jgi:16S rRNA (uracil1498-N3)-methyltransferase
MPAERYYTCHPLIPGQTVIIDEQEFHHLSHVMRKKQGHLIELVNGKGQLAEGCIESIEKKSATVAVRSLIKSSEPSSRQLILAQGVPRLNRLEFILEKGVELGATEFWLFPADLSEKESFSANQQTRLQQIVIAAMKQCGRLDLPEIVFKPPLQKWPAITGSIFFGDTRETAPFLQKKDQEKILSSSSIICFIGPEKGFSKEEIDLFERAIHAQGIRLHENILRTDTAAITILNCIYQLLHLS